MPGIKKCRIGDGYANATRFDGFCASVSRLHYVGIASVRDLEHSVKNGEGDHA
ncbi:MAG: hypothetical protein ACU0BK_08050 [Shimia sp.]|jgi:hypothetical protein|uniref:hypothetical protein n=1 Tax=Shimia sp. TaxID=1954381 RepID=UPI00405A10BF